MDGLVSTGNKFPYTILKNLLPNAKIFLNNFINILAADVDCVVFLHSFLLDVFVCFSIAFLLSLKHIRAETLMDNGFHQVATIIFFHGMINYSDGSCQ